MSKKSHAKHPKAPQAPVPAVGPRTLALDIGGTGLKCTVLDEKGTMLHERMRVDTPVDASPAALVEAVVAMAKDLPPFDRISAGYPGAVRRGHVVTAPHFSDASWVGFDLAKALADAFGKPTRVSNDADIQGLGVIKREGIEFVLTLGTGAGTAAFRDGIIGPHFEFAHHPVHGKKSYNDYVGKKALEKIGKKRWNKRVRKVIAILESLVHYDHLYIGGGNASHIEGTLPDHVSLVSNDAGMTGGIALWQDGAAPE
ncbi:ROK family protein [Lichenihabitans sp. Uapishka_5]|uniref:ROK family protein n=1 Tax=Lichenihabitans sp. Uapishka_5 TaxID=3037302 RepID=UPI0029E7F085|nr:ROK family protein [Lichenihabitans sp. Uapishka_5]MDX7951882.1 ROK family protein [Lichenihabitans sp. Uapishka_5]